MRQAYTLIEIVIIIAIMGVLTAVAVPAYDRYNIVNNFDAKSEEVLSLFNRAYLLSTVSPRSMGGSEYNCDTAEISLSGTVFTLQKKRTTSAGLEDCGSDPAEVLDVNDNTSLDTITVISSVENWRFKYGSYEPSGSSNFQIVSSELSSNGTSIFRLNNSDNQFTIKNERID